MNSWENQNQDLARAFGDRPRLGPDGLGLSMPGFVEDGANYLKEKAVGKDSQSEVDHFIAAGGNWRKKFKSGTELLIKDKQGRPTWRYLIRPTAYIVVNYDVATGDVIHATVYTKISRKGNDKKGVVKQRVLFQKPADFSKAMKFACNTSKKLAECRHSINYGPNLYEFGLDYHDTTGFAQALKVCPLPGISDKGCVSLYDSVEFVASNPVGAISCAVGGIGIALGPVTGGATAVIGTGLLISGIGSYATTLATKLGIGSPYAEMVGYAAVIAGTIASGGTSSIVQSATKVAATAASAGVGATINVAKDVAVKFVISEAIKRGEVLVVKEAMELARDAGLPVPKALMDTAVGMASSVAQGHSINIPDPEKLKKDAVGRMNKEIAMLPAKGKALIESEIRLRIENELFVRTGGRVSTKGVVPRGWKAPPVVDIEAELNIVGSTKKSEKNARKMILSKDQREVATGYSRLNEIDRLNAKKFKAMPAAQRKSMITLMQTQDAQREAQEIKLTSDLASTVKARWQSGYEKLIKQGMSKTQALEMRSAAYNAKIGKKLEVKDPEKAAAAGLKKPVKERTFAEIAAVEKVYGAAAANSMTTQLMSEFTSKDFFEKNKVAVMVGGGAAVVLVGLLAWSALRR